MSLETVIEVILGVVIVVGFLWAILYTDDEGF